MKVIINGRSENVDALTLFELCNAFQADPMTIATAINGNFVAVNDRLTVKLQEGDRIEILSPRQGG